MTHARICGVIPQSAWYLLHCVPQLARFPVLRSGRREQPGLKIRISWLGTDRLGVRHSDDDDYVSRRTCHSDFGSL
jgi:hypothetical protein